MISTPSIALAATSGRAALDVANAVADTIASAAKARAGGTAMVRSAPRGGSGVERAVTGLAKARPARASARRPSSRSSGAGYAKPPKATGSHSTSTGKAAGSSGDALSFLRDPRLSIEEKMLRLLAFLNERWEKEMQQKLEQIEAGERGATAGAAGSRSSTPAAKKKKSGPFGSLGGMLKSALAAGGIGGLALEALKIPAVRELAGKLGGPVLAAGATALGFPALAPLLLQHGSKIVDLAAGLASALDGAGESGPGGGKGAGDKGVDGGSKMSDAKRQQLTLEIQRLYEKQKEMFGLVSNILRVGHDTRMSIVNNVR